MSVLRRERPSISLFAVAEVLIYRERGHRGDVCPRDVVTLLIDIKEALVDGEEEEEDEL